jgi:hypothetical protein
MKDVAELVVAVCSLHRICTDGAILVTEQDSVAKYVERVGLPEVECALEDERRFWHYLLSLMN